MEILYPVDCERYIPSRFDIVRAAAVRARALARGAEPKVESEGSLGKLALREIAEGRFDPDEIQTLLSSFWASPSVEDVAWFNVADEETLRDGLAQSGAIALASQQREARATASMNEGGT